MGGGGGRDSESLRRRPRDLLLERLREVLAVLLTVDTLPLWEREEEVLGGAGRGWDDDSSFRCWLWWPFVVAVVVVAVAVMLVRIPSFAWFVFAPKIMFARRPRVLPTAPAVSSATKGAVPVTALLIRGVGRVVSTDGLGNGMGVVGEQSGVLHWPGLVGIGGGRVLGTSAAISTV